MRMMVSGVPSGITLIDPLRLWGHQILIYLTKGTVSQKNVEKHCDGHRKRKREGGRESGEREREREREIEMGRDRVCCHHMRALEKKLLINKWE